MHIRDFNRDFRNFTIDFAEMIEILRSTLTKMCQIIPPETEKQFGRKFGYSEVIKSKHSLVSMGILFFCIN